MSTVKRRFSRGTVRLFAAAVVACCAFATTAEASERGQAERLYTKGLAELHSGNDQAAIALFDQAVAVDPDDARGRYYRALGYGHLGRYKEAVADLEIVVAADDPAIDRDRLELAYALYRLQRYDEAAAQLEIASKEDGPSTGEALMLLGIVETRRGNAEAARAALQAAESKDPSSAVPARYYQGLAAWRAGDTEAAVENFTWVSTQGGDSPYAREATAFLDRLDDGGARPYRLYAGAALEYDSNVGLVPGDDTTQAVLGVSDKGDGRAVLTAGGQYMVYASAAAHASLGYDFLQSLHFDLSEYDVQTHRVGGQADYVVGPVTMGVAGGYEYSMLDGDSLLNGGSLLPWVRVTEADLGRSEVYYRARGRDYVLSPYSEQRDSWNHAVGARQFFALGERGRDIMIGYRFDADRGDRISAEPFDYNGHQFEAGLLWAFDEDFGADLLYAYKLENYSAASGNRDDDEHHVIVRAAKRLAEYVWLTGSYVYVRNDSDNNFYEYSRHITSLGVELRY